MSTYKFVRFHKEVTKQKGRKFVKRLVIIFGCAFLLFLIFNFLFPIDDQVEYSTIVEDDSGSIVNAYLTADDKWRMKTDLDEISPLLQKTIIAKEDKHFYKHPGIDPFAIGRAFVKNLFKARRTSGASTITMQVARALEGRKRTFLSKCIEAFRALQLEWKYEKKEILQLYVNLLPYGGNLEGVKAASLLYFKKNPDHLSLAEITTLAIIPNRPSSLVVGRDNQYILTERNRWLKKFAADGEFSAKEIEDALAEPLTATRGEVPHFIPHLAYCLKNASPGQTIQTNIRLNTQLKIEKLVEDYVRSLRLRNIKNASVIVIDNKNHKVISYVGSANFWDTNDGGQVNGAAALRQPGSTLKPLLYALCVDEGLLTPKAVLHDVAVNYSGYAPENYDQKFNGTVTMEYALEQSLNIPAVRSFKTLGKERLINKLSNANFRQVQKDGAKLGLSMILGGCGATLEELTGLFSAFANNGMYVQPKYLQSDTLETKKELVSAAAGYMVTEILSKVNRPDFPLNWQATGHMPKIAWKTGTSYGRKDAWSIGYNKQFTVGVWVGNFSGLGVAELSGANTATPLLFKIFNSIDYYNNGDWFEPPADCELRLVCAETGLPPGSNCTNMISDYFIPLVSSTASCRHLEEVKISADEQFSYCQWCVPGSGFKKKFYKMVAPEIRDYLLANGRPYKGPPEHNPACESIFTGNAPSITSPLNGTEFFVDRKNPEPLQLSATASPDVSKLYWYINDQFYKTTSARDKQFFIPAEGPVKISCTDDKGRNRNIWIKVRYAAL